MFRRTVRLYCLLLATVWLPAIACQPRPGGQADARVVTGVIQAGSPAAEFQTVSEDNGSTSSLITLRWPGEREPPTELPKLALCLPSGREIQARWLSARLGDITITPTGAPEDPKVDSEEASEEVPEPRVKLDPRAGNVEFVGYLRRWPIYRLSLDTGVFKPFRELKDQVQGSADYTLVLELTWDEPAAVPQQSDATPEAVADVSTQEAPSRASWRRVAGQLVINPQALALYAEAVPPSESEKPDSTTHPRHLAPGEHQWARLYIESEGLVRIDPDELLQAGFRGQDVKAEAVRIFSQGEPVPLVIAPCPAIPQTFAAGVYFWGRGGEGAYSRRRCYWVTLDESLPAHELLPVSTDEPTSATPVVVTVPRTARLERDNELKMRHGNFLAIEGMKWVDAPLEPDAPLTFEVALPHHKPQRKNLEARIGFFLGQSRSLNRMRVELEVDGYQVGRLSFYGPKDSEKRFEIPARLIRDDHTTITVRLVDMRSEGEKNEELDAPIWFDKLEVDYPAATGLVEGRLTLKGKDGPNHPTRWNPIHDDRGEPRPDVLAVQISPAGRPQGLAPVRARFDGQVGLMWSPTTGKRIEVFDAEAVPEAPRMRVASLEDPTEVGEGTDLLIILHQEFREPTERLAAHHRQNGWRVRLVEIQSIYDTFSYGALNPEAIRAYLRYILDHWGEAAPGHVLLVGDCNSDYLNVAGQDVRNWVPTYTYENGNDRWASDYWLTTVAGKDDLGDFMIGRLSVASREDATKVIDKLIDYDRKPQPGPWRSRLAYVADNGEFTEVVDTLRRKATPRAYGAERIYLDELPFEDNWYLPRSLVERKRMKVCRAATEGVRDAMRTGVAYLTYYGHGSPNIWADERIWFGGDSVNSDNQHVADSGHYTFIANMTCNSGAIDYPTRPWNVCITEDLMRVEGGGAIACFVPSGPGVTTIHRRISGALRRVLFDDGLRQMGEVVMLAKARYGIQRHPRELLYMYVLLGDPAIELQMTGDHRVLRMTPDVFSPGQSIVLEVNDVKPPKGRWIAELTAQSGRTLWKSEAQKYKKGRIRLNATIPDETPIEDASLRVYCWDPGGKGELALGGTLKIERPRLTLGGLELVRADQDNPARLEVTVQNPTGLPATGDLEVVLRDAATTRPLVPHALELTPGEARTVTLGLDPLPEPNGPLVADVVLRMSVPPGPLDLPQVISRRELIDAPADWTGLVGSQCELKSGLRQNVTSIKVVAASTVELPVEVVAGLDTPEGETVATLPIKITPQEPAKPHREHAPPSGRPVANQVTFKLQPKQFEDLQGGTLWLGRATTRTLATANRLESVPLDNLVHRRADVRIVPSSLRYTPLRPTAGDTVFVDLEIENVGNAVSEPMTIGLLDQPPTEGGQLLPNQVEFGRHQLSGLAPGRRLPVTLRWDPSNNAGSSKVWVHLMEGYHESSDSPPPQRLHSLEVEARTKPDLEVVRVWAEATEDEVDDNRMRLLAEVRNKGQTNARRVMVSFYRSRVYNPENKLGEMELKVVEGEKSTVATLAWEFDPGRDFVKGTKLPHPSVQVWLKGSSQRVGSIEDEENTGEEG